MTLLIKNFLSSCIVTVTLLLFSFINHFPHSKVVHADIVDGIVAIINDEVILESELKKEIELYEKGSKLINFSHKTNNFFTKQTREKVLNLFINEKIIQHEAKRFGINCTLEEVNTAIEHIKKINNCYQLDKALKHDGISMDDLRQALKKQILKNKIIDRNIYPRIAITEKMIIDYYNNNPDLYDGILNYHIDNILIKVSNYNDYNDLIFALNKIFIILQKLESGYDFNYVSKIYSSDENVYINCIGIFSEDELSGQMKKSMIDLKLGNSSKIIKTKTGFQFFHISNITKTAPKSLEMVRDEIYHMLVSERTKTEFNKWLDLAKKRSSIKIF